MKTNFGVIEMDGKSMEIEKVVPDGIYYIDDLGQSNFLSFGECNNNWLNYRKRVDSLNDEQIARLKESDKTVGQRNVESKQNFIEFFTRPFTRFIFNIPEQINEYEYLRDCIQAFGWTTHDLS